MDERLDSGGDPQVILNGAHASRGPRGSEHSTLLGPRADGAGEDHLAIVHQHVNVPGGALRSSLKRVFDLGPDGCRGDRGRDYDDPIGDILDADQVLYGLLGVLTLEPVGYVPFER